MCGVGGVGATNKASPTGTDLNERESLAAEFDAPSVRVCHVSTSREVLVWSVANSVYAFHLHRRSFRYCITMGCYK